MTTRARRAPAAKKDKFVRDPFVEIVNGVEVTLPSLSFLKPGLIRKIRHEPSVVDQQFALLEHVLDDEQMAVIDDMDPDEFAEFCTRWKEHSQVDLGES